MYIPDVYVKAQNDWVDNFYKQNGYLGKYIVVTQFAGYCILQYMTVIVTWSALTRLVDRKGDRPVKTCAIIPKGSLVGQE